MAPLLQETAPVVYANELKYLGKGHALWRPEGLDGSNEIEIGDVGYIHRGGAFVSLFNITKKSNTSSSRGMRRYLPESSCHFFDFEESDTEIATFSNDMAHGVYGSRSVKVEERGGNIGGGATGVAGASLKIEYSVGGDRGAICYLPENGDLTEVLSTTPLRQYFKDNVDCWYEGIKKKHHIKLEDLIVVFATVKSPQFQATAVVSASKSAMANVSANVMNTVDFGVHARLVTRSGSHPVHHSVLFGDGERPDNAKGLSIMLRYYKIKQRLGVWKSIVANAGPHVLPPGEDPSEDPPVPADYVVVDDQDSETDGAQTYLLVDALLDYILEVCPEAERALACDEDVLSLFLGEEIPDDIIPELREKNPRIVVDERKVASLALEDVIRKERVYKIVGRPPSSLHADNDEYGEPPLRDATVTFRDSAGHDKRIEWPHQHLSDKAQQLGTLKATSISPDGKLIAVGFDDSTIIVWDLSTSAVVKHLDGHEDGVYALAFSPNGTKLASGSADMRIIVWTVIADKDDRGRDIDDGNFPILEGHELDIVKVAYSPDGSRLASAALDGTLNIWDASHRYELLHSINTLTSSEWISFTPDSKRIMATIERTVYVWNVADAKEVATLTGHERKIYAAAISHDGTRIATASEDKTARVWNIGTGEELLTLHEHNATVWCIAFSADDGEVATGSDDTTIVIADSWTGQRRAAIAEYGGVVNTLAYSNDGRWICSGTMEGNVRLLDARSGKFVAEYQGHEDKMRSVAFSPDAHSIITSSEDGTVRTFSVADILRLR